MADLRTLAEEYPQRTTGSDASNRAALWISESLEQAGLRPHVEGFVRTIDGEERALQNVWARSPGDTRETIVVLANRDVSPLHRQGANSNASGVATLLELARGMSAQRHARSIIFLFTDGDTHGTVGTLAFLEAHPDMRIVAALTLEQLATPQPQRIRLHGWSEGDDMAPAWLWAVAADAGKAEARLPSSVPNIFSQVLHLAVPLGGGNEAPFVERGIPALAVSVSGARATPLDDDVSWVSQSTLRRAGRAVERLTLSIDAATAGLPGAGPGLFFSRHRRLPGLALRFAITVMLMPLVVVTVDLLAAQRRRRQTLGPAWLLYAVRYAPWIAMLVLVYLANLVGLLPGSPGLGVPPDSWIAAQPRYFRLLFLAGILVAIVYYAHVIERMLLRRTPVPREATVTVVHAVLLAVAFLVLTVNPFSIILVLPAALLWPLARYGPWPVSRFPAWAGLLGIGIATAFFAVHLGLGMKVWWYFFVLLEDRTVPAGAALLGAALIACALHLGHHLHKPLSARPDTHRGTREEQRRSRHRSAGGEPPPADEPPQHPLADQSGGQSIP